MSVGYESRWRRALTFTIPIWLFSLGTLFPFYWMLVTSVRPDEELYNVDTSPFYTLRPTLAHVRFLFTESFFAHWMWNTLVVAVVSTAISLVCGILAGYALSRLRFRGATTIGSGIFISYLVPPTLLFIPLVAVVGAFHLLDSPWSLILTYPTFLIPFCTWLLMGYFKTIPREIEESAWIDGASRVQTMIRIVLPTAMPGILSAGIFAFTLSWNEFLYALVFISSPQQKTVPVGVVSELIRGDVFFWGPLMAGALLGSVPVALIYSRFVEYYVQGMTGAVKG
jgi:multiple sugar transport system permease protein